MDLSAIPIVDNHCHSLLREPVRDRDRFRLLFARPWPRLRAASSQRWPTTNAALIEVADELGVPADEEAVLTTRATRGHEAGPRGCCAPPLRCHAGRRRRTAARARLHARGAGAPGRLRDRTRLAPGDGRARAHRHARPLRRSTWRPGVQGWRDLRASAASSRSRASPPIAAACDVARAG